MSDIEYSVWCEKLQEKIEFDSTTTDDHVEMFNVTTIAGYFGYSNKNIVDWFNNHMDTLHLIDSIITGDDIDENEELLSISENTIIKIDDEWFVNMNVLVEYLRTVDMHIIHEIIAQVMYDKAVADLEEEDMSEDPSEDLDDEEETDEEDISEEDLDEGLSE